jgi:hypothetical protein
MQFASPRMCATINRWGHAYNSPQPGFFFGTPSEPAPLEVIRKRYGRIAFGHSELSGRQSRSRAAQELRRALKQVLEVRLVEAWYNEQRSPHGIP